MGIKTYGVSESQRGILESAQCREIAHEILNFGVNQSQILILIKLLALELEDRQLMLDVTKIIDEKIKDDQKEETTIIV
tara:strand:+ start:8860 stop:9096 length:237 start_codon:yes stop_codon:yes gene_type:complete